MLKIIYGRARTGKTGAIMREIKALADNNKNSVLIVPEQYGHEAERELAEVCGDALSLHAEVMSFTAYLRKLMAREGGVAVPYLDKGGKLLCMALTMQNIGQELEVFRLSANKPEFQDEVLRTIDEFKRAGISAEALSEAAGQCSGELASKLNELALILESYNAIIANGHADPADRMTVLADIISCSNLGTADNIFIDGFIDFTGAEYKVISAFLKKDVNLTVCLTADTLDEEQRKNEIFSLSRSAARKIIREAEENGCRYETELFDNAAVNNTITEFAERVFECSEKQLEDDGSVSAFVADNITAECEFAAAKALELVREKNCRWKDIAIAAKGFSDYRPLLERVFSEYSVPIFVTSKTNLTAKPIPLLIEYAYEITLNGWLTDDVLSYLGTGFTGLEPRERDDLSTYIYRWQLKESAWKSSDPWTQHPDGYAGAPEKDKDETAERLSTINAARKKIARPLLAFARRNHEASVAAEFAASLAVLLEDLKLDEQLTEKSAKLRSMGRKTEADEYIQIWDVIISAVEQTANVLGEMPMTVEQFAELFLMMLSKYDISIIPVSLDSVSAGEPDRMRKRNVKYLILLGADDSRIPGQVSEEGLFSEDELEKLYDLGTVTAAEPENEIWRDFSIIYNCLSLPSEGLILSYSATGSEGVENHRSIVIARAEKLFQSLQCRRVDTDKLKLSSFYPAVALALDKGSRYNKAARAYFTDKGEELENIEKAAAFNRGALSSSSVAGLYGDRLKISASRADGFFSCRYAYFCNYGLNAKPYKPAAFDAAEVGTFTHYVLENVAAEVSKAGGFRTSTDEQIEELVKKYIAQYAKDKLNDLREKTERFRYLFRRMGDDILQIALNTAAELRKSDFIPKAFELNFGKKDEFKPVRINDGGDMLQISGIADRVDAWQHAGKTYLRVVDYKTGSKEFSLSDIWYGMSMQMLLYLYALQNGGNSTEKALDLTSPGELLPAGVMYVPARSKILPVSGPIDDEALEKERAKKLRRSGIVINDKEVINAWENGDEKLFSPIKFDKSGEPDSKSTLSSEQIEKLYSHIKTRLSEMAKEIREGNISPDPYEKSSALYCDMCPYAETCRFVDGENNESIRKLEKIDAEKFWELVNADKDGEEES